jgi:hypothetical protein
MTFGGFPPNLLTGRSSSGDSVELIDWIF